MRSREPPGDKMIRADEYERRMLELINAERAAAGVPLLQLEQHLNMSAELHSRWMLQTDTFSHSGAAGSSAHQRMIDADFDFAGDWMSAENISIQSTRGADGIMDDVADLHQSLMNSPSHRDNILNPDLAYIGIGIEVGQFDYGDGTFNSVIVTQNFAATDGSVVLDITTSPDTAANAEPTVPEQTLVADAPTAEEAPEAQAAESTPPVEATEPANTPPHEQVSASAAEVPKTTTNTEETDVSPWLQVASGDTFEFLETLADELAMDDFAMPAARSNDLTAISHAMVRHHFEVFESNLTDTPLDDLSF